MHPSNRIKLTWRSAFFLILALFAFSGASSPESEKEPSPVPSIEGPLTAFHSEVERDYNLRSIGQLQVTNLRGPVAVQGWAQDKIRVKAKRTVYAANADEAKKLFAAIDFRYQETEGNIEFSGQYGQGLSIAERIQERARSADLAKRSSMEMTVFAPSNLKLKVWASEGAVSVKGWNSDVELRSSSGEISGEQLKGSRVSCLCQSCEVHLKNARGSVRAMSQSGSLILDSVSANDIYLESASGSINMQNTRADTLLLVTKTGSIAGKSIQGNVEFHTQQGSVLISGLSGFASGKSDAGNIEIQSHSWVFNDNALIESQKGNVTVSLPSGFAGDVDVWSKKGQAGVDFPLKRSADLHNEPNHWVGRIGEEATDLLKIFSDSGNVKLSRSN